MSINRHNSGFTLLELMITLAIAAILSSLAAPSFSNMIKDNRMTTQYNELLASLSTARSEAIKRGITITLCKSNDLATPACGGNWQDGWIVFVDDGDDGTFDVGTDELLKVHSALSGGNNLNYNGDEIRYSPDGLAQGFNGTFTLCDDRGNADRKGLIVSNTGRARKAIAADALANCP